MNKKPMISLATMSGLLRQIAESGGSPDQVLRAAGIPRSAFSTSDGFIPTVAFSRMLEEAARSTGDGCFGLHFGEGLDLRDLGALHYVVVNSSTVADAISSIVRYIHIHNRGATVWWEVERTRGYLRYTLTAAGTESQRQHNEFSMASTLKAFRVLAGARWTPSQIQFMHTGPDDVAEHRRVFGCDVGFGCSCNALVFERDLLERVVPTADPKLYLILKEHVERALSEIPATDDVLHVVSRTIAESFGDEAPTLQRIGKKLGMSSRTLERRLNEHGVVFRNLVRDIRLRLALDHLERGNRPLAEIAFLLGYSEVSAFTRAFKRWHGLTPTEYRSTVSSG